MADYAGALAAIRQRFADNWTATPFIFQNTPPPGGAVWPPVDVSGQPVPWVYFEVLHNTSDLRGIGLPGAQLWIYRGHIFIHVYVPKDYGIADVEQLVVNAGEIFRAKTFYTGAAGQKVQCFAPYPIGGASDADNGSQFVLTCGIQFEFFFSG